MLKIYGRANSINVRKVLWLAGEIGLEYTREDWGRGFRPTNDPEFKKVSAFGVVPVIDDDGFILRESNTICRYLAAKHGRTDLFPADIKTRATIEAWMDWAATDFYNGIRPVVHGLVFKTPGYDQKSIDAGIKEWTPQMHRLDAALATQGPYLMGKSFTLADIPAGLAVNRWYGIEFPKPAFNAVAAYYDLLAERPGFRAHGRNGTP
jgi:glutathione S-transferase